MAARSAKYVYESIGTRFDKYFFTLSRISRGTVISVVFAKSASLEEAGRCGLERECNIDRAFARRMIELDEFVYRSVVLFTNSPFQRPHVSSRAVAAKNRRFTARRTPIGPKKYAKISMSPVK